MTRFIALAALGLSVVACVAVPVYMQRQTQQAIDRAMRQREAQLVERYKPLLHELGERYIAAAEFENAQTVDQMIDALVQIVRAAAEAERQTKLEQGAGEAAMTSGYDLDAVDDEFMQAALSSLGEVESGERGRGSSAVLVPAAFTDIRSQMGSPATESPLTGRIAFIVANDEPSSSDIHVMNADGSEHRQITDTRDLETSVALSPDGRKLAWVSDFAGRPSIYTADVSSRWPRMVIESRDLSFDPQIAWAPEGNRLALTMLNNTTPSIHFLDIESRQVTKFLDDAAHPAWSPDGSKLAFRRGNELMFAEADGSNVRPASNPSDGRSLQLLSAVRWLPDNMRVVFTSYSDLRGYGVDPDRMFSMYLWNVERGVAEKLTRTPNIELPVDCSPDGRHLLFLSVNAENSSVQELSLIRIDGGALGRRPFRTPVGDAVRASWSVGPASMAQR